MKNWKDNLEKFCLVSMPRNGTHYLRGLLNSHPHIKVSGEIFLEKMITDNANGDWPKKMKNYSTADILDQVFCGQWNLSPHGCAFNKKAEAIAKNEPDKKISFGLLLHAYNTRTKFNGNGSPSQLKKKHGDLWNLLEKDESLQKIIYLKRKNSLQTWASQQKANKHLQWQMKDAKQRDKNDFKILFDNKKFLNYTKGFQESFEKSFLERFSWQKEILIVYYEDFVLDEKKEIDKIIKFLEAEEGHVLNASTIKQETKKMKDVISNFDDARAELKGTEYEQFLDT